MLVHLGLALHTSPRDRVEAQLLSGAGALVESDDVEPRVRRLVELAAGERFIRTILDEGPVVARLVRRCAEWSANVDAERLAASDRCDVLPATVLTLGPMSRRVAPPPLESVPLTRAGAGPGSPPSPLADQLLKQRDSWSALASRSTPRGRK